MTSISKNIWLLTGSIGIVGSNSLLLSPIAHEVAQSYAASSATDVLNASAVYGGATAISALWLAPKADRFGLKRALIYAFALLTLALILSAAAPMLWVLILAQFAAGMAAGVALPCIYGLCAEIAPEGKASETLGKVLIGWTISLVLGVTLSALIADNLHWRAVYAILGLAALITLIALARSNMGEEKQAPAIAQSTSPIQSIRIPGVTKLLLFVAAYMIALYGLYAYLGTYLTQNLNISTSLASSAMLAYGIGFGVAAPLDRGIDRFGQARSAPFIFAALMLTYFTLALVAHSALLIVITSLIWGVVNHLGLNILVGQLTHISPQHRASIMGLYSATTYFAMFGGIMLYKPIFESHGFASIAVLSAFCILPTVLASLRATPRKSEA